MRAHAAQGIVIEFCATPRADLVKAIGGNFIKPIVGFICFHTFLAGFAFHFRHITPVVRSAGILVGTAAASPARRELAVHIAITAVASSGW